MITVSAMATTLFLGGWRGPWLPPVVWFLVKLYLLIFLFIWLRGTLPRFQVRPTDAVRVEGAAARRAGQHHDYGRIRGAEVKMEWLVFVPLAAVALVTAVLVIILRNPVYCALSLVGTFFALSGLYLLLHAQFIAVVQVIVYAGAIMVCFCLS